MTYLHNKLEELKSFLVDDGYNDSNSVYQTLVEAQELAIDYSQCCTPLKTKKTIGFDDWLIFNRTQKTSRLYFKKMELSKILMPSIVDMYRRYSKL